MQLKKRNQNEKIDNRAEPSRSLAKSNLIEILKKFSGKELNKFGEFIRSPFFNKNQAVIKLYEYIVRYCGDFDDAKLNKELVFKKSFPGADYDDSFINSTVFSLTRLAEKYLSHNNFMRDPFVQELHLIDELFHRKLDDLLLKRINEEKKKIEKVKLKDFENFKKKFNIEYVKHSFDTYKLRYLNYRDIPDKSFFNIWKVMLDYFFAYTVTEARFLFNLKRLVKFDFKLDFLEEIINYLKEDERHKRHEVSVYFYELMLLKENDEQYYYKLKEVFKKEVKEMKWEFKFSTISILTNYATEEYYRGKAKYIDELFDIANIMLEHKLYSHREGGYFENHKFIQCANIGVMAKKYDWTEKFIEKYKRALSPDDLINFTSYAYAKLNFARKNYDKSLEYLTKVITLDNVRLKASVKNLYLMLYYELGWVNQAFDAVDSYRHFLRNDKVLPEIQKEWHINFMKLYHELLKLKSKGSNGMVKKLKLGISDIYNTAEKDWLLEKVDEL